MFLMAIKMCKIYLCFNKELDLQFDETILEERARHIDNVIRKINKNRLIRI